MEVTYDIFEQFLDGTVLWHAAVPGIQKVRIHLLALSKTTSNQLYAVHPTTQNVIWRVNERLGVANGPSSASLTLGS